MSSNQLKILGAQNGAFSIVTKREATGDRSVTLDKCEKLVLEGLYPLNSFTRKGGGRSDKKPSHFKFRVHSRDAFTTSYPQSLSVTYPKKSGNELRLYMQNAAGFDAKTDDVFYIFSQKFDLLPNVGFMNENDWNKLWAKPTMKTVAAIQSAAFDGEDDDYQHAIEAVAAKVPVFTTGTQYPRNPNTAWKVIKKAKFSCELSSGHQTFISASSGQPYMEAHHLVPMGSQSLFSNSLDVEENIVCLCPTCHRRIHLSVPDERKSILLKLYRLRKTKLNRRGITLDEATLLKSYYLT